MSKKSKPKIRSEWAEYFRKLPETLIPQVKFEETDQWGKVPYRPTEFWIVNAGGYVHRLLRLGVLKEYEIPLLSAFCEGRKKSGKGGEISLWKELIKILRARANLPYTRDYLKSFDKDCQLVAESIVKESKQLISEELEEKDLETWQAEAIKYLYAHRDWSIDKIAKKVGKTRQNLYRDQELNKLIKARNQQKRARSTIPRGEKNAETGKIEAWKT